MVVKQVNQFKPKMLDTIGTIYYNEGMLIMTTQRGKMKARIPCTYQVRDVLSNLSAGADVTYDEFLRWLLHKADISSDMEPIEARTKGLSFYEELHEFAQTIEYTEDEE